jgi:hypothetical protein
MRKTLQKLQQNQSKTTHFIGDIKYSLRTNCLETQVRQICFKIHCLNSEFYENIEQTKTRKFRALHPTWFTRATHCNNDKDKLVVTIPGDLHLEPCERSVLSKGLKFIPTKAICNIQLQEDLERFYRRLRLHAHFNANKDDARFIHDEEDQTSGFEKFKPQIKKTWTPKEGEFPILDAFIHKSRLDVSKLNTATQPKRRNISPEEQKALFS